MKPWSVRTLPAVAAVALAAASIGSLTGAAPAAAQTSRCGDVKGAHVRASHIVSHDDPTSSHLVACKIGRAIASKAERDGGVWLVSTRKIVDGTRTRYSASYAPFTPGNNELSWWDWVCIGSPSHRDARQWRCGRALGGLDSVRFRSISRSAGRGLPELEIELRPDGSRERDLP